jgi:hypothetical protein
VPPGTTGFWTWPTLTEKAASKDSGPGLRPPFFPEPTVRPGPTTHRSPSISTALTDLAVGGGLVPNVRGQGWVVVPDCHYSKEAYYFEDQKWSLGVRPSSWSCRRPFCQEMESWAGLLICFESTLIIGRSRCPSVRANARGFGIDCCRSRARGGGPLTSGRPLGPLATSLP